VRDLAGDLQLILEALNGLFVEADLGLDQFQGDDLVDLLVIDSIDFAHAAPAQLFDHFIAAGKEHTPRKVLKRGQHGFCGSDRRLSVLGKRGRALMTEPAVFSVLSLAGWAFHRSSSSFRR
jgi:hypothetical protein